MTPWIYTYCLYICTVVSPHLPTNHIIMHAGPDVDECAMGIDNCDSNAECMNTEGSFNCTCNPGYTGDGLLCNGMAIQGNVTV